MTKDSKRMLRFAVGAGIAAVAIYLIAWNTLEYMRSRHGPWEFEFWRNSPNELTLIVTQPGVGVDGFEIVVEGVEGMRPLKGVKRSFLTGWNQRCRPGRFAIMI